MAAVMRVFALVLAVFIGSSSAFGQVSLGQQERLKTEIGKAINVALDEALSRLHPGILKHKAYIDARSILNERDEEVRSSILDRISWPGLVLMARSSSNFISLYATNRPNIDPTNAQMMPRLFIEAATGYKSVIARAKTQAQLSEIRGRAVRALSIMKFISQLPVTDPAQAEKISNVYLAIFNDLSVQLQVRSLELGLRQDGSISELHAHVDSRVYELKNRAWSACVSLLGGLF